MVGGGFRDRSVPWTTDRSVWNRMAWWSRFRTPTCTRQSWCRTWVRHRARQTRAGKAESKSVIQEHAAAGKHRHFKESSAMSKELLLVVDAVANEKGVEKDVI